MRSQLVELLQLQPEGGVARPLLLGDAAPRLEELLLVQVGVVVPALLCVPALSVARALVILLVQFLLAAF